ncbi:Clp protease N-terminal domain-containing protein [Nocardia sp. NPDC003693]
MFDQMTDTARKAIRVAQEEARALEHSVLGPAHLLLSLYRLRPNPATALLEAQDIDAEAVAVRLLRTIGNTGGSGGEPVALPGTLSAGTKQVLELTVHEAFSLGDNHIGAEHLLLGLIREGEDPAARTLAWFGADAARMRSDLRRRPEIRRAGTDPE